MAQVRPEIQILLVEDDLDHIDLACRIFEKLGVTPQVQVVRDGAEALDFVFGRGRYAAQGVSTTLLLILLDLNLPKIPGLEVLRRLKADPQTETIPVVIVTISKEDPDLSLSFAMGVRDYIIKPMEYDRFVNIYNIYVLKQPNGVDPSSGRKGV